MPGINEQSWSQCYSDEDGKAMGLANRDDAMLKNCRDMGFAGATSQFEDCGGWKFKRMCQNPNWNNSGDFNGWKDNGCIGVGKKRFSRQVDDRGINDWEAAAQMLLTTIGNDFYGKRIFEKRTVKNNGMWIELDVEDLACNPGYLNTSSDLDGWKNDGCTGVGIRRWARQVDAKGYRWEDAAQWLLDRIDNDFYGKKIVDKKINNAGAAGIWIWVFVEEQECNPMYLKTSDDLDGWKNDGCTSAGIRRWARQVDTKGYAWEDAAQWLLDRIGTDFYGKKVVDKKMVKDNGMWIWVFTEDGNCPKFEDKKQVCHTNNMKMEFQKCIDWGGNNPRVCLDSPNKPKDIVGWIPCAIGSDPSTTSCSPMSKNVNDFNCVWGQDCFAVTKYEESFECDKERFEDAVNRRDKKFDIVTASACYSESYGDFGEYHSEIMEPMTTDTIFTLEARNWISAQEGAKTFLKGEEGALRTDDKVLITSEELNGVYQFRFMKENCQTDKFILYGNRVQLYCVGTKQYVQCGAGTCSMVADSGECLKGKWQTFFIESSTGKTGRVCFGDDIYIKQTTGNNPAITPAGDNNVWAQLSSENKTQNGVLSIKGKNGSIYKDPEQEMESYETQRCDEICTKDPVNPACTLGVCSPQMKFWNKNKLYIIIIAILFTCSSIVSAIMKVM
jgi:hypothetical protein